MKLMSMEVGALVCGFQLPGIPLYPGRALFCAGLPLEADTLPPEGPLALLMIRWSGATCCVDAPRLLCCGPFEDCPGFVGRLMGGCFGGEELPEPPPFIVCDAN